MAYISDQRQERQNSNGIQRFRHWVAPLFDPKRAIINPIADMLVIYASPLWSLLIVLSFSNTGLWHTIAALNYEQGVLSFICGALSSAHLLAVVFRSHMNPAVFNRWPVRFTLVPAILFFGLSANIWLLVIASVIAVFWDVYHSAMQNFGLSRIYDMRMGNDAHAGRLLDSMMNLVLYAGPITAGVTLAFHIDAFSSFAEVGAAALTTIPGEVMGKAQLIRWIVIPASLIACLVYMVGYLRLIRNGYKIAPQKVVLMTTSGLTSIVCWGFNPFATAFAIMNVFHAIQYFGILYAREGNSILKTVKADRVSPKVKPWMIVAILMVPTVAFGAWEMLATPGWDRVYALFLTVTLMHFWYDGFIWSVRNKQV